jgi:hypothetical protein
MLEAQKEALARVETSTKQTPLEFALACMNDEMFPPSFRLDACKVAIGYCHAKMAEAPPENVEQITEIRRVIVRAPERYEQAQSDFSRHGEPAIPYSTPSAKRSRRSTTGQPMSLTQ